MSNNACRTLLRKSILIFISWFREKTFEIQTVLYVNGLVRNGSNVPQLSQLISTKDSVEDFVTSLQKRIFFISLNYWNFHGCKTLPRKQYSIYLSWIGEKTLKSGLYFYKNCIPVKITSPSYRSLSSVRDSVHGFVTQLQKRYFLCPWIYWNVQPYRTLVRKSILILISWFGEKNFENPDSILRKRPG